MRLSKNVQARLAKLSQDEPGLTAEPQEYELEESEARDLVQAQVLDAALVLAAQQWPVFPVRGKRPITPSGFKDATTDEETIRSWFRKEKGLGVGLATGSLSGVMVIDVDKQKDGYASLRELAAKLGELPKTAKTRTPRGGEHLFFQAPAGLRSRAGIVPGIDLKAEGGYVVVPPSPGLNGTPYKWIRDLNTGIATLPPEWEKQLRSESEKAVTTRGLNALL